MFYIFRFATARTNEPTDKHTRSLPLAQVIKFTQLSLFLWRQHLIRNVNMFLINPLLHDLFYNLLSM